MTADALDLDAMQARADAAFSGPWRVASAHLYDGSDLNVDAGSAGYICKAGTRGDEVAELIITREAADATTPHHCTEYVLVRDLSPAGAALETDHG